MIIPIIGFGQDSKVYEEEMIEITRPGDVEFEEPFLFIEQMPLLGDCMDEQCTQTAIMKFIAKNFRYPEIAKAHAVEGRVILEFVVENDGTIGRVEILRGINPNLYRNLSKEEEDLGKRLNLNKEELQIWINNVNDGINNECIRVIKLLPKFTPGTVTEKAVPVKYTVPIKCLSLIHI